VNIYSLTLKKGLFKTNPSMIVGTKYIDKIRAGKTIVTAVFENLKTTKKSDRGEGG